jgi:hypothetical protein
MRYFLAFLVTLGLILLLFTLLFRSGGGKSKTPVGKTLDSYSTTDAVARVTIDGPINADQTHQALRISVGRDEVTFEKIQGYQGNVVSVQNYANNSDAYANFLLALSHAGFTKGSTPAALKDERGYCPLGDRYVFELTQEDKEIERYWATNCGKPATYLGAVSLTLDLFRAQVPDYNTLTQNIAL